ncbi:MAG: acetylxylan esterase, partial [Verrucomicrobiae bacterium]|nr:acetylxylan esterase [Verrucomicrobiae bacterium]
AVDAPEDFDAFWKDKIAELEAVPMNPVLEAGDAEKEGVDYYKIWMDNINGSKIQGQLAMPSGGQQLPALLRVQWAGVYGLKKSWVTDHAANGWLVLNILAHDLPIDKPDSFYQAQREGPLKDYFKIGSDDRNKSYFLRMYLSCYRAAEYLKTRPEWNGKTLVVEGTSQGGQQTLITAGLHPDITAAMALVPAGCDMMAPSVGRERAYPYWYYNTEGKNAEKVWETSRYFDAVNFAARIDCPLLVGLGLRDRVCPPAGIFAAVNQVVSFKEVIILPESRHQNENGSQDAYTERLYEEWLPALKEGKPIPEKKSKF